MKPSNIKQCLIGAWDGPKAKELRARVINDSQINENSEV
ncbi:unknow [Vibrio campbellii]|nr:unknow [Vibrio campbellii]